jgi:hypothetical protein
MSMRLIPLMKPLFSLAALLACAAHAADWEPLPPLPEPNGGFILGVQNEKVVIVGGTNWEGGKKHWLSAIHAFDPAAGRWTKLSDIGSPVAYATTLQEGAAFAYLGGTNGEQSLKALVVIAGEATSRQLNCASFAMPSLPASLVLAAGGHVAGRYVIAGGTDNAANIVGVQCMPWKESMVNSK